MSQIFVEIFEENIKKIHINSPFPKRWSSQTKTGLISTKRPSAGSAVTYLMMIKEAIITKSETTVISRESIAALPIENATSDSKSQSSLQLYSKIWPIVTHICPTKISVRVKEKSNVFPIMTKNTSALAKTSWLANTSTKKNKRRNRNQTWDSIHRQLQVHGKSLESLVVNLEISGSDN